MTLDLCHAIDNIRRAGGITQAPPCHRIRFGHTVDDDRFFLDVLSQRCKAVEAKVFVHQLVVDLICDNVHILFQNDICQSFELVLCVGGPGRIGGVVKDKSLGCWRYG